MKRCVLSVGLVIAIGGSAGSSRAGEATPEEIVDRAIRAHGGDERLAALTGCVTKSRTAFTDGVTSVQEISVQFPIRFRSAATSTSGGKSRDFFMLIDGDQGWIKNGDIAFPYTEPTLGVFKKNTLPYTGPRDILRLRTRQKNPACHFAAIGESSLAGRPVLGLRMTLDGGPQETWYFAKDTGLLLKTVSRSTRFEGDDDVRSTLYEDYQDFDGFPLARKITYERDGKLVSTSELTQFKAGVPDPGTFAKP